MAGPSDRWSWELPSSHPSDPAWSRPSTSHWPRHPGRPASTPSGRVRLTPPPAGDFRRTVVYTIAGTAPPGLGLIAAKRRVVGCIVLGLFLAVLATLAVWAALDLQGLVSAALRPSVLPSPDHCADLGGAGLGRCGGRQSCQPAGPAHQAQRITGGILVGALAFAVAAPMAVASRYRYIRPIW